MDETTKGDIAVVANLARLVRDEEAEVCAKIVEREGDLWADTQGVQYVCDTIAAAIRARISTRAKETRS